MIINRHNYEEFFLLYVDNELTPEQRAEVETFVQQNGDLTDELEMLKQSVLSDEKIEFEWRESLYHQEQGINTDNYEEYFLLAVDNELDDEETEEVEKFILKHPQLQNEFVLLKQAKLQTGEIVFEGKHRLYRKERKAVIPPWMRVAAAAAVFGLIAITWIFSSNQTMPSTDAPVVHSVKPAVVPPKKAVREATSPTPSASKEAVTGLNEKPGVKQITVKTPPKNTSRERRKIENYVAESTVGKNNLPVEELTIRSKVEQAGLQKVNQPEELMVLNKNNKKLLPSATESKNEAVLVKKQRYEWDETLVRGAAYREIDNEQDDEERTFYIGSARINKSKLKGLFKKVVGLFDKKTQDESDKTLNIAAFQIKSK